MNKKINIIFISIGLFVVFMSATVGSKYFEISKQLEIFNEIFKDINTYYVDDVEPKKLMDRAINSMLKDLDPYTNYLNESQKEDFMYRTEGEYGGIGNSISKINEDIYITKVYKNSPSYKAGIRVGNTIKEINDIILKDKNLEEINNLIKGSPGTEIKLKIFDGSEEKELTIIRETISINSVDYKKMLSDDIGYIHIRSFIVKTTSQVLEAYNELKAKGMKKMIIDLRGNPGGLLDQAVSLCNIFIDKNVEIVNTKGKLDKWNTSYKTKKDAVDNNIPIVILVDNNSASASEIVSGTMQDLDRGIVIGQRTYGKGLVQQLRDLSYGTQLKVTTAKYYIPSGRCIQSIDYYGTNEENLTKEFKTKNGRIVYEGKGIKPDIEIKDKKMPTVLSELIKKREIFLFVNDFVNKNNTIPSPKEFKLSDKDYNNFLNYVKDKKISIRTESCKYLDESIEKAKKDNYLELEKKLEKLQEVLDREKEKDFDKYKNIITNYLSKKIIERYYYNEGVIEYSLNNEMEVQEGISILNNKNKYSKILNNKL